MRIDPYAAGSLLIFGIVVGIVTSAALGAWIERRRYGRRVFQVQNHTLSRADVLHAFDRQPDHDPDVRAKYAQRRNRIQ